MKFLTQVKPNSYQESRTTKIRKGISDDRAPLLNTQNGKAYKRVVKDVKSFEEQEGTLALLKILALGSREIEKGKFREAED